MNKVIAVSQLVISFVGINNLFAQDSVSFKFPRETRGEFSEIFYVSDKIALVSPNERAIDFFSLDGQFLFTFFKSEKFKFRALGKCGLDGTPKGVLGNILNYSFRSIFARRRISYLNYLIPEAVYYFHDKILVTDNSCIFIFNENGEYITCRFFKEFEKVKDYYSFQEEYTGDDPLVINIQENKISLIYFPEENFNPELNNICVVSYLPKIKKNNFQLGLNQTLIIERPSEFQRKPWAFNAFATYLPDHDFLVSSESDSLMIKSSFKSGEKHYWGRSIPTIKDSICENSQIKSYRELYLNYFSTSTYGRIFCDSGSKVIIRSVFDPLPRNLLANFPINNTSDLDSLMSLRKSYLQFFNYNNGELLDFIPVINHKKIICIKEGMIYLNCGYSKINNSMEVKKIPMPVFSHIK